MKFTPLSDFWNSENLLFESFLSGDYSFNPSDFSSIKPLRSYSSSSIFESFNAFYHTSPAAILNYFCHRAYLCPRKDFPQLFDFFCSKLGIGHFSYHELIKSSSALTYGIINEPLGPKGRVSFLHYLYILFILECVRTCLGSYPLCITSGYRNDRLNTVVGGAPNSYHTKFRAVDIAVNASDAASIKSHLESLNIHPLEFIVGHGYLHLAF
ncbi:MAG: peptidase M15 [Microviridae sp.]|nr:MAG: peptidase M15 [Microviridae sp.]